MTRSCQITATWAGNADYLASSSWMFAGVRPRLTLAVKTATRSQTKFRLTVSPEQPFYQLPLQKPPFIADVQCRVHGAGRGSRLSSEERAQTASRGACTSTTM